MTPIIKIYIPMLLIGSTLMFCACASHREAADRLRAAHNKKSNDRSTPAASNKLKPTGPSSARGSSAKLETDLYSGDFKIAAANIDNNKFLLVDRNHLLYLMEKGKLEYLAGHYSRSNELFEQAYQMIDDKIKTKTGQAVAAVLTNPMAAPYKGEDFEKVAIHYYKALNYFALGNPGEALIEAKRINIKLTELNDKYKDSKNKYAADAFSQIVQGVLYESTGDINNAFIAYRDAEEIYAANNAAYFGVPMPEQLKYDLVRTAGQLGFTDELQKYQTKFGMSYAAIAASSGPSDSQSADKPEGEVVIFWENGLGPVKDQTKITVGGSNLGTTAVIGTGDEAFIINVPAGINVGLTSIAIPKYVSRDSYYKRASVMVNDREQFFELSENYDDIAKQCLKDRMGREVLDIAIRAGSKKAVSKGLSMLADHFLGSTASQITSLATGAINVATEKADLRNWQSLPATISYVRIPVKMGDNVFTLKKYGPNVVDEDNIHVTGKPGLQIISYSDLGRTIN